MTEAHRLDSVATLLDMLGVSALARTLGHANVSTVSSWKARRRIPVEHWRAVIAEAAVRGVVLDADRLMRLHAPEDEAAA